jgi:hypothetical protein
LKSAFKRFSTDFEALKKAPDRRMYEGVPAEEVERRIAASHDSVQAVYGYWRQKAAGRLMPTRADIEPADLKPFLPAMMLVDVVHDTRRFVYRLVGTHEVAGRGRDPTGLSVGEAFYAGSAEEALAAYEYVAQERRPFCYCEPYITPDGWEEREDTIYLPLTRDGETVGIILVYAYTYGFKARGAASLVVR